MTTPSAKFTTAAAVARSSALDLDAKPERWHAGAPFDALDFRPGRVVLIGAPPGAGKTTLTLQLVSGILANHPDLRAVVGNVEMAPTALVEKLLARLAAVPLDALQDRTFTADERRRIEAAIVAHAPLLDRIAFLESTFTLRHLAGALVEFRARLAVIDYAQRFATGDGDDRAKLDVLMSGVRMLANAGACVILVSSVARQKGKNGSSTYAGLNLASFRGSSEIEFGADAAFILEADSKSGIALLKCEKDRFRQPRDIPLRFNGALQTFTAGDSLDQFDAARETETANGETMNDRRPEPGSSWAKHCADAWPREWLDERRELPPGFTRAADPLEADLITGRITEAAFLLATGQARRTNRPRMETPSSPLPARSKGGGKGNPVVVKLLGYRRFFNTLPNLEPRLSPGAVSVWCWLWTCERKELSRCSVRKLAKRFRSGLTTTVNRLKELRQAGFIRIVRRRRTGSTCTVVRIRPTPKRRADTLDTPGST